MEQSIIIGLLALILIFIVIIFLRSKKPASQDASSREAALAKEIELLNQSLQDKDKSLAESSQKVDSGQEELRRMQGQLGEVKAEGEQLKAQLEKARLAIEEHEMTIKQRDALILQIREEKAKLQADSKALEERMKAQKEEINSIQERFNEQFQVLANKILEEKTKKFTEVNKERMDQILQPLHKNLDEFRKLVVESYTTEGKERHSLGEEVKKLMALNQAISQETKDLTEALKGSSKQQGDWGEMVLGNILEQSGLTKGREYFIQESLRDEDGSTIKNEEGRVMRPDVIVQYPDKRKLIIDSKVSLTAYVEFTSASDKDEQERVLKKHMLSIRKHIDELSSKSYQDYGSDLDFVMMFVPVEGAYVAAMQDNPNLWNEAFKKNVLLISPTNLIAALRMINDMWERDKQSKNAEEIAVRGGRLYEKFVGFLESMDDIGKALSKSQSSFDNAYKQLYSGRGNLINQAQQLDKLGIKYNKSKQIPSELAQKAEQNLLEKEDNPSSS